MNKRKILCFAMAAVMAFAISGAPELTAAKKSKKVKLNKSKITLRVGETYKLKLKNNKKKVTWSSSKKKIAKVGKKGKVTALKKGKAKITAKVAKKKYICNVTVKKALKPTPAPVTIANVSVLNPYTISVQLSASKALTKESFAVKLKTHYSSNYIKEAKIRSVTSTDNITYLIALASDEHIYEGDYVQVAINKLSGTDWTTKETVYRIGNFNYPDSEIYELTQDEEVNITHVIGTLEGYAKVNSITGLPAGLVYKVNEANNSVTFTGKPSVAGTYTGTIVSEDEFGNIFTDKITWLIGAEKVIAAAYYPTYKIIDANEIMNSIHVTGGSGSYTYKLVEKNIECKLCNLDYTGKLTYTVDVPGTYQIKVKVTDANDPNVSTIATCDIFSVIGKTVTGTIKDALGNAINTDATIYFKNKDDANPYMTSMTVSIENTSTYTALLAEGTYDCYVEYSGSRSDVITCNVNADKTGVDLSLPLYPVTITCDNTNVDLSLKDWKDVFGKKYNVSGNIMYLEEGTYNLTQTQIRDLKEYTLTIPVTVTASANNTAKVVVTEKSYKDTLIVSNINVGSTIVIIPLNGEDSYFKFIPEKDSRYSFSVETDDEKSVIYTALYDATGQKLVGDNKQKEVDYELKKDAVYYIGLRGNDMDTAKAVTINAIWR